MIYIFKYDAHWFVYAWGFVESLMNLILMPLWITLYGGQIFLC